VLATRAATPRQAIAAVGVLSLFLLPLPWLGSRLVAEGVAPLLGGVLENSSVLAFLVLLVALPVAVVPAPSLAVS
jgi:hypothetical protein